MKKTMKVVRNDGEVVMVEVVATGYVRDDVVAALTKLRTNVKGVKQVTYA